MEPQSSLPYSQAPATKRKHLAYEYFVTFCFSRRGFVSASPNPQAGGPPLVGCPRLLIQFIRSYPPYRRPFLHPQPEDAPCRGDRDPQTRSMYDYQHLLKSWSSSQFCAWKFATYMKVGTFCTHIHALAYILLLVSQLLALDSKPNSRWLW
jgi:hypothetical protein